MATEVRNLKLVRGRFGDHRRGSVLPPWAVERAGPVAAHVANGTFEWTTEPVNVDLRIPAARTASDPAPEMAADLNRLREENAQLAADNKAAVALEDSLRRQLAARDAALGKLTADNADLQARLEKAVADLDELNAFFEKQTEPEPAAAGT